MIIKDLSFKLGETWEIDCSFHDRDGQPLNLAGGTVSLRISDRATGLAVLTLTQGDGFVFTNDVAGEGTATIPPSRQTGFSPFGRYEYEAQATTAAGVVSDQNTGLWVVEDSLFA